MFNSWILYLGVLLIKGIAMTITAEDLCHLASEKLFQVYAHLEIILPIKQARLR